MGILRKDLTLETHKCTASSSTQAMKDGWPLGDLLGGVEDAAAIPARLAMLDMIRGKEFGVVW